MSNKKAQGSGLRAQGLVLIVLVALALPAHAQDARQIVAEAQKRTQVKSERYEGMLQVFKVNRKIADKAWVFARIGSHGDSKSVLRFTAPAEVKGVALLVVNHRDRASDQWMWTPAIARDRRIALQDRSQRFFGTDFSFEDLEERDTGQYDYSMIADETVEGASCWKIEARPRKGKSSQYTSSFVWVRKDNYAFQLVENYTKGVLARRLRYSRIENVQGIWAGRVLEMSDVRRNSRTILTLEKLQYNVSMKDEDFTLQALRRR